MKKNKVLYIFGIFLILTGCSSNNDFKPLESKSITNSYFNENFSLSITSPSNHSNYVNLKASYRGNDYINEANIRATIICSYVAENFNTGSSRSGTTSIITSVIIREGESSGWNSGYINSGGILKSKECNVSTVNVSGSYTK